MSAPLCRPACHLRLCTALTTPCPPPTHIAITVCTRSSTDNMFTIGSVCIDRRGFHWKAPGGEVQGAASSRDNAVTLPWMASGGPEPGDEWRRGSRNYLEAKRGLRESGKLSFGGFALPNLSELTTLTSTRNYSRSVRLEDLVKIKAASECLGKGVSGTVWKVRDKSVDETLALKEMAMDTMDEVKNQTLVDEMRIMLELDHPSIVACHGVFYELGLFKIVMEFCDAGSLLDVMRIGNHTIPVAPLAGMMAQVLEAMSYLHTAMRVIHRDVKPGNLLLTRQGHCKLADFGVCSKPRDSRDSMCATWVGTVTYMSPERLKGNSYSFNADVWALGVIVVEATLGRYPYLADHTDKVDAGEFGEGGARKDKFEFWDLLYSLDDPSSPCATKKLPHDTDKNLVSFAQYVLDKVCVCVCVCVCVRARARVVCVCACARSLWRQVFECRARQFRRVSRARSLSLCQHRVFSLHPDNTGPGNARLINRGPQPPLHRNAAEQLGAHAGCHLHVDQQDIAGAQGHGRSKDFGCPRHSFSGASPVRCRRSEWSWRSRGRAPHCRGRPGDPRARQRAGRACGDPRRQRQDCGDRHPADAGRCRAGREASACPALEQQVIDTRPRC